jgi:hypothetical protein
MHFLPLSALSVARQRPAAGIAGEIKSLFYLERHTMGKPSLALFCPVMLTIIGCPSDLELTG